MSDGFVTTPECAGCGAMLRNWSSAEVPTVRPGSGVWRTWRARVISTMSTVCGATIRMRIRARHVAAEDMAGAVVAINREPTLLDKALQQMLQNNHAQSHQIIEFGTSGPVLPALELPNWILGVMETEPEI